MKDGPHIPEEVLALYAMSALDPVEKAAVEAHLSVGDACNELLAQVAGDLALIGLSVEQHDLPAGARARFLSTIQTEAARAETGVATPVLPKAPIGRSEPVLFPASSTTDMPDTLVRKNRRGASVVLPWLLAAAALAGAAYLGSQLSQLRQDRDYARGQAVQLAAQSERAQEVLDALTSPAAQHVTLTEGKPVAAPTGRTSYLPSRGALIFVANNLRALPASQTYELWLIPANGKAPMPAGTFRPDEHGTASVVLPDLPQGVEAKAFGVTIEQAAGSQTPTLPIILSGS